MSRNQQSKTRRNQTTSGARRTSAGRTAAGTRRASKTSTAITRSQAEEQGSIPSSMASMTSATMQSARKSLDSLSSTAVGAANTAINAVKQNPMPYALAGAGIVCAGAGLTWLLMSSTKEPGSTRNAMPAMKETRKAVKRAGERASQLAYDAVESGKKLESSMEDVVREHPIAVGAALIATGAAIGLAIPRTTFEDGWLGRERDQLVSSAQRLAQGAVSKVESIAKQVTRNASSNSVAQA